MIKSIYLRSIIACSGFLAIFNSYSMEGKYSKRPQEKMVVYYQPETLFDISARASSLVVIQQENPLEILKILPDEVAEKVIKIPIDPAHRPSIYYARTSQQVEQILGYWLKFKAVPLRDICDLSAEEFAEQNNFFSALSAYKRKDLERLKKRVAHNQSDSTLFLIVSFGDRDTEGSNGNNLNEKAKKLEKALHVLKDKSENQTSENFEQFYLTDLKRNNLFYLEDNETCKNSIESSLWAGERLEQRDVFGNTPLQYSLKTLRPNAAQALVAAGASCTTKEYTLALKLKFNDCARTIFEKLDPRSVLENKVRILGTVIQHNIHAFISLLRWFQACSNFSDEEVHELVKIGAQFNYQAIGILCDRFILDIDRCDIDDRGEGEWAGYPLSVAAANNTKSLEYLLSLGAQVNTKHTTYTPLESAITNHKAKNIVRLLEAGADVYQPSRGKSIIEAALEHNIGSLPILVDCSQQSIDFTDPRLNCTQRPFIVQLAESENLSDCNAQLIKMVLVLLDKSIADINATTAKGKTFFETYIETCVLNYLNEDDFKEEAYKDLHELCSYLFKKGALLNQELSDNFIGKLEELNKTGFIDEIQKLIDLLKSQKHRML